MYSPENDGRVQTKETHSRSSRSHLGCSTCETRSPQRVGVSPDVVFSQSLSKGVFYGEDFRRPYIILHGYTAAPRAKVGFVRARRSWRPKTSTP